MQLLEKYGKNYFDAPSSKNMTRAIVMHIRVKIWQNHYSRLFVIVCYKEMQKIDCLECSDIVSVSRWACRNLEEPSFNQSSYLSYDLCLPLSEVATHTFCFL